MSASAVSLSELQRDALKEAGNIGAGHAATSLSQLLNTSIALSAPTLDVMHGRDVSTRADFENRSVAALHMYVEGEAPGQLVVVFDRERAHEYVASFIRRIIGDIRIFDSIADTTLGQLTNIMAGAYLSALSALISIALVPSVPTLAYGTLPATFGRLLAGAPDGDVLLIGSSFLDKNRKLSGRFILIPEAGSLHALLAAFGVAETPPGARSQRDGQLADR